MELQRRVGQGYLAEAVGPDALPIDRLFRSMNFRASIEDSLKIMPNDSVDIVRSFVKVFLKNQQ